MAQPREIPWQSILDLFTEEIKNERHAERWKNFQSVVTEEEIIKMVYSFDIFRKRINAWHTKFASGAPSGPAKIVDEEESSYANNLNEELAKERELLKSSISLKYGESDQFPGASSVLEIQTNEEKGRHVVALKDFQKGDVLFKEEAFTSVPCGGIQIHCDHCCAPLYSFGNESEVNFIACDTCNTTRYCTFKCVEEAKPYHQWECGSNLPEHVGIAWLGLRVALMGEIYESTGDEEKIKQYQKVCSLVTHIADMTPEDKLQYSLTSLLLSVDVARRKKLASAEKNQFIVKFGSKVMKHITQLVCNGNAITSHLFGQDRMTVAGPILQEEKQVRVATAIFPSASMMNHSCDPNILTSYFGNSVISKAVRDIKAGEEVFNCYGIYYRAMRTEKRQRHLKEQYMFDCKCLPCQRSVDFLDSEGIHSLMCVKCKGPAIAQNGDSICLKCDHIFTNEEMDLVMENVNTEKVLLQESQELHRSGAFDKLNKNKIKYVNHLKSFLHPNNCQIAQAIDQLAMLYVRKGNYIAAWNLMEECLTLAKAQYGSDGIEVAGVISTMMSIAQAITSSEVTNEILKLTEKAIVHCEVGLKIMAECLGEWNDRYKNMLEINKDLKFVHDQVMGSLQQNGSHQENGKVLKAIENLEI
ncbi:SET and MYND domain-containing protein 4-like [Neocloeon triangulifer]|uniref:SET and MYND domain-containing protein 4-like n=1 Tax=Neocloeon triangulifer TaxID=2078957 RepID=UPI00286F638A|nr:SET and MYND domain-containing protein 4-like [Neocloeon triangulifer]